MRTRFKATTVLLAAGVLTAACGGTADTGATGASTTGGADPAATEATEAGQAAAECGEQTIRLSFIASDTSTWQRASDEFAEQIGELTDGRVTVETYAGGQLAQGNQQAELQQTQQGVIDAQWVSPILLALYADPRFDIYSLPFLFPDHETANEVVDGEVGDMIDGWVREAGLEPLGWGVNGFRQVTNSERPIRTPEDLEGLRFRVAGTELYQTIFAELGAQPVTMSFGEVFTSLQQGAIDGQENPLSIIFSSSLYSVQDHLSLWNYSYDPLVLIMNEGKFASFCEDDREALTAAAQAAGDLQRVLTIEEDETLVAELEAEGMQVVTTEEVDVAAFQEAIVEPIYEQWTPIIGEENLQAMLDAVEAAQATP